jgi:undecaprenyl-diphosphatase
VVPNVAGSIPVDRPISLEWILSLLEALILGLIQGFTEFLPISSSAHLKIAKEFLNLTDSPYFDLICHGGTTLALGIYLRKEIWQVLTTPRAMGMYFCAIIPLIPAYFLFGKFFKAAAAAPQYLGYCLMTTGILLFLASRQKRMISCREIADFKWRDVVWIGMMQTIALIPGISRSGSTISAARFCGWNWLDAARFSFLLAVPTILGGEILEVGKLLKSPSADTLPWECYTIGFMASFIFGLAGVRFMFHIYEKEIIRPFAWYCLGIGLLALVLFHA